jgi:hypothetical protein
MSSFNFNHERVVSFVVMKKTFLQSEIGTRRHFKKILKNQKCFDNKMIMFEDAQIQENWVDSSKKEFISTNKKSFNLSNIVDGDEDQKFAIYILYL